MALPLLGAILGGAGSLLSGLSSRRAGNTKVPQIDIEQLNRLVSGQAEGNALRSLELERAIAPENQQLRRTATRNLLQQANRGTPEQDTAIAAILSQLQQLLSPQFEQSLRSNLLEQAIARAGSDLAEGGNLPLDVRNAVTRRGIARAGTVGGGQLGTSRAIVPRDLGLTSLDLRDRRLATAGQLGQTEAAYNEGRAATSTGLRSSIAGLLSSLAGSRLGQTLGLASFGQSLAAPQVGLSPSDVANIYAGNQANAYQGRLNKTQGDAAATQQFLQGLGSIAGLFN